MSDMEKIREQIVESNKAIREHVEKIKANLLLIETESPQLFILWHGVDEWEGCTGTIEDAKRRINSNHAYLDYGRKGAMIIQGSVLYAIDEDGKETHHAQ